MNGSWNFRPSILSLDDYRDASLSRATFLQHYQADNRRALQAAAVVNAVEQQQQQQERSKFRTLQWNLNGWAGDAGVLHPSSHAEEILNTILEANADCILLNEYHWNIHSETHAKFEASLKAKGYETQACGSVDCPTFVATRWRTTTTTACEKTREIVLSSRRSGMVLKLVDENGEAFTVVGTHLDHLNGQQRQEEMHVLLQELFHRDRNPQDDGSEGGHSVVSDEARVILAGDLNQQRQQDYPSREWKEAIAPNMDARKTCRNDGVADLLQEEGFLCAWNHPGVKTNWSTPTPPSTHWSGTIVDYSYGRNVRAESIRISPAGWSDHRMTLVDWTW